MPQGALSAEFNTTDFGTVAGGVGDVLGGESGWEAGGGGDGLVGKSV